MIKKTGSCKLTLFSEVLLVQGTRGLRVCCNFCLRYRLNLYDCKAETSVRHLAAYLFHCSVSLDARKQGNPYTPIGIVSLVNHRRKRRQSRRVPRRPRPGRERARTYPIRIARPVRMPCPSEPLFLIYLSFALTATWHQHPLS